MTNKLLVTTLATLSLFITFSVQAGNSKNHAALFVGATTIDSETHFTLGGDFEHKFDFLPEDTGLGLLIDGAFGDHGTLIVGVPFFYHLQSLKVFVAPGLEFKKGEAELLARLGSGYDFHIGKFSLGPQVAVDYVDSEFGVVYGLTLGMGF